MKNLNTEVSEEMIAEIDSHFAKPPKERAAIVDAAIEELQRFVGEHDALSTDERKRKNTENALLLALEALDTIAIEPVDQNDCVDHAKHSRIIARHAAKAIRGLIE
jgi:hypothetical protein